MNSFDVYFLGKVMEGHDLEQVKSKISEKFKVFDYKLEHMFSGNAVRVKADVDVTLAGKYREIFRELGALVDIVPAGEPVELIEKAASIAAHPESADEEEFELLPAKSGSLIDTAPDEVPSQIPDTDAFGLSPPGALLPEAHPESPLELDISHMETLPLDSGPVEHFAEQDEDMAIPDTSHLQAADPAGENLVVELEEQEAQPLPDISHLDAAPANTGSLEDCKEEKEPTPIPDLSKISISYD